MPIEGFNGEEFAKSIAQQAMSVLPKELDEQHKNFVVQTLYKFCALAGNAVADDESLNFTTQEASIITQFIGEWTFHKSIDMINAGLPEDTWEPVLQKIAFAVFEKAKEALINKMDQAEGVDLVEAEVKTVYAQAIKELAEQGLIEKDKVKDTLSFSNLDKMAAQEEKKQITHLEEEKKMYKIASMAIVLRDFPPSEADYIINTLAYKDAKKIRHFMSLEDLDGKVDPELVTQYLNQFKNLLPSTKIEIKKDQLINAIIEISNGKASKKVEKISQLQRPQIKEFLQACMTKSRKEKINKYNVNAYVGEIIYNYLRKKTVR